MFKKTARKVKASPTENIANFIKSNDYNPRKFILKVVAPVIGLSLTVGGVSYAVTYEKPYIESSARSYMEEAPTEVNNAAVFLTKGEFMTAYGLYFNDELIGAMTNSSDIDTVLDEALAAAESDYKNASAQFNCEISIQKGVYQLNNIFATEQLKKHISEDKKSYIKVVETATDTLAIVYGVETRYDPSKPEDYYEVVNEGKNGSKRIVSEITYENGVKTGVQVLKSEIITEPVDKVIVTGSKIRSGVVTGSFVWPCDYTHYIYSGFGYREDGYHGGIDINEGDMYGQDVLASDGGTVITAAFDNYGYGYHVEIDHGNGYVTRYAHLSDIFVEVGEKVSQRDVIGAVGSTGDSEAPHLHFEIIAGDQRVDPEPYLN